MNQPFEVIRSNRFTTVLPALTVLVLGVAVSLPWWGESSTMREVVEIACYFVFAMMWNLLAGYGGMVSIGQQAFFGFGGYVMLILGNEAGVHWAGGGSDGIDCVAGVVFGVSFAGRLFCDWHMGNRRGFPSVVC